VTRKKKVVRFNTGHNSARCMDDEKAEYNGLFQSVSLIQSILDSDNEASSGPNALNSLS
jgi:hypothetical protein